MGKIKILLVDDEPVIRKGLSRWLRDEGYDVALAESGESALTMTEETGFDLILLDIQMKGINGIEVLKRVKDTRPFTEVIMITGYGSIRTAIEAMKMGALDYLLKPIDPNALVPLINRVTGKKISYQNIRRQRTYNGRFENMLGQSEPMKQVFDMIEDVAPMNSTVLITGETGTGKGLAARAIHTKSSRSEGPFVTVNCGSIPERLMESELFGYQRGAFTDAKETKKGRLEQAHGGTLFLDEIGEISMRMQVDLLRVLEDRVFYRVGGTYPIKADFRIIAATNKDLQRAISEGTFREDLFYRIDVVSFRMPLLRERKGDIPLLAEYFLSRCAQETNKKIGGISREALDELMLYEWPGNVRELENAVERAVVVSKNNELKPDDLPIFHADKKVNLQNNSLSEIERAHIINILDQNNWNISRCAEILSIDRSTLYNKMKRYNISRPL